jgi:hypothetical protein
MIVVQCTVYVLAWDRDGNMIASNEFSMHSFVANYNRVQEAYAVRSNVNMTSTSGAGMTLQGNAVTPVGPQINAAAGIATYGIVIGAGGTAVTINDYQLVSAIAHGTNPGQLYFSPVAFDLLTWSATEAYFLCRRHFNNYSTGSVTVTESGLVGAGMGTATTRILMARDVFPSAVTVPPAGYMEVRYKFGVTTV